MSKQHISRVAVLVAIVATLFLGNIITVSAHAVIFRSDPQDGAVLGDAPRQIHLWFNDIIVIDFTGAELVDDEGKHLPASGVRVNAEMTAEAVREYGNPKAMVLEVDLPELSPHAYRLDWKSRSADDLHQITGSVIFGVQHAISPTAQKIADTAPQPLEVGMRWISFAGISGLAGALTLLLTILRKSEANPLNLSVRKRLVRLAGWCGIVAFVAGLGLLFVQGLAGDGPSEGWWLIISRTAYGFRWLLSQGLLVVLVAILFPRRKTLTRDIASYPIIAAALIGLTLALLVVQSLNGHSPAAGLSPLSVVVDVVHLLSAGMWVGGVLALVVAVVPLLRKNPTESAYARTILKGFGGLAALSLLLVITTGLYKSGEQVATVDGLLTTLYGQALLVKVYLVLFLASLGFVNALALHPKVAQTVAKILRRPEGTRLISPRLLRRTLVAEAGVAVLVLLLAALISTSQPARGPEFEPVVSNTEASSRVTTKVEDILFNFTVKPNRPGQNFVTVGAFSSQRPAPTIQAVKVELDPPGTQSTPIYLEADSLGKGQYQIAGGYISKGGNWQIKVTVVRPGLTDVKLEIPWVVASGEEASEKRPVIISNQPIGMILTWLAGLLALLAVTGFGAMLLGKKLAWNISSFRAFTTFRQSRSNRRSK